MINGFKIQRKNIANKKFVMLYNFNQIYVEEYHEYIKQVTERIKMLMDLKSISDFVVINMETKVVQKFVRELPEEEEQVKAKPRKSKHLNKPVISRK